MVSKFSRSQLSELIEQGKTTKEMAEILKVSVRAVNDKLRRIGGPINPSGRPSIKIPDVKELYAKVVFLKTLTLSDAANMLKVSQRTLQRRFAEYRNASESDSGPK